MSGLLDDPSRRQQLERRGYCIVQLLDREQIERLLAAHARLVSGHAASFHTSLWSAELAHRRDVHAAIRSVAGGALAALLPGHRLCLANFAIKESGEESACPLHRDWSFVDETRYVSLGVWAPLVDVDETNGCLAVLPGSHELGRGVRPDCAPGIPCHGYRDVDDLLREQRLELLPLTAGQAVVYHPGLLHGSPPNRSGRPRTAMVTMHIPTEAPLMHYYRGSISRIETYQVDDDFYWRECIIGQRPKTRQPVGTIEEALCRPPDPWGVLAE